MKTTENGLEILKINGWLKIEKPLQILRFLRFGEYMEKSASMFLKPYRLTIPAWSVWSVWKEAGLLFFRCESIIQLDKLGFDEAVNDEKVFVLGGTGLVGKRIVDSIKDTSPVRESS